MPYPVKIYNGNGEYVETIVPEIDYLNGNKSKKKFQAHPCRGCKEPTTNLHYCSSCQYNRANK